jgi:valyl-tRNA synthetase
MAKILEDNRICITDSTVASEMRIIGDQDEVPRPAARAFPTRAEVHVPLAGLIDIDKERERLEKALGKAEKEIASHNGKLANENFISKAPADVVEMTRKRREELAQKAEKLKESLAGLSE